MSSTIPAPMPGAGPSPGIALGSIPNAVATLMGAVLVAVGVLGFATPGLLHAHLNWAHNVIHIVTGLAALGAGLLGSLGCARAFNVTFGMVYGLLGVVGYVLGDSGIATVGHAAHDARLWVLIPGTLELGAVDHAIHVAAGLVFVLAGVLGYSESAERTRPVSGH